MNRQARMIHGEGVLFCLMLFAGVLVFGNAQGFHQHDNIGSLSSAEGATAEARVQFNSNATLTTEVLPGSFMLLAQKGSKSDTNTPKAEGGKAGNKGSEASTKDDDDDDDLDQEEDDEDDDEEDTGKSPATKEQKGPKKIGD